jgi:cysteine desulfurase
MSPPIYLDYAAATPLLPTVVRAMRRFDRQVFANPSSITGQGVTARAGFLESSTVWRVAIAALLHCHPDEIIFTGSGTESTNLATTGIMTSFPTGEIVTSAVEHHAVLEPARALAARGYTHRELACNALGQLDPAVIIAVCRPETRLLSIIWANNEIGTIQPLVRIVRALRRHNRTRAQANLPPVFLHTDACQAAATLPLDVTHLGIDALSLNAGKIGGPKGVGLLYLRRGTPLTPLILGGGQEQFRRAGTENVAGIVGFAAALQFAQARWEATERRARALQRQFLTRLQTAVPDIRLNGHPTDRLATHLSLTIPGVDAEALVLYLDHDGVAIGSGAACSTWTLEPSHVLLAIGRTAEEALQTIRITFGQGTTAADLNRAANLLIKRIQWLRKSVR